MTMRISNATSASTSRTIVLMKILKADSIRMHSAQQAIIEDCGQRIYYYYYCVMRFQKAVGMEQTELNVQLWHRYIKYMRKAKKYVVTKIKNNTI